MNDSTETDRYGDFVRVTLDQYSKKDGITFTDAEIEQISHMMNLLPAKADPFTVTMALTTSVMQVTGRLIQPKFSGASQ